MTEDKRQGSNDERHTRVVIGIPCLVVGGTEMQTLMLVRALRAKRGSCQLPVVCCSKAEIGRAADAARLNGHSQSTIDDLPFTAMESHGYHGAEQPEPLAGEPATSNKPPTRAFRITVVCYFEHDAGMVAQFKEAGAEVVLLDLNRNIGAADLILKLRTIFAGLKPDILHIQYMAPGLLPIVAARLAGISNIIATVHQPATPYGRFPRLFLRIGAMLCKRFVCVSAAVEKSWFGERRCGLLPVDCGTKGEAEWKESVEAGQEHSWRHLTIHNAVDTESIDRILATTDCDGLRRELGLEGVMIVGTIARLSHEKGVDILIKAFVSVHRSNPAARLLIVGDGQERASLIQLSRDLGLESDVVWAGSQTWERAMQHLSLMDVVVVPSRYEGFGLTAIEAMACAKPVVAFNHDSLAEVLGTGTPGSLVSAGDIKAMSASIAALLTDYDLSASAGRSNRERTEQLFGFDLFQHRVQSLYHSLSTTHHSP